MKSQEKVAILDFGGQYTHLIANRIRKLGVYSEILSPTANAQDFEGFIGIIFSGGPSSVNSEDAPDFNLEIIDLEIPKLGICYGHQLICQSLGGIVNSGPVPEFGTAKLNQIENHPLWDGVEDQSIVWMSHGDEVHELPDGFKIIASTTDCPIAAVAHQEYQIFGLQFHPEVTHSHFGNQILKNFLKQCNAQFEWSIESYLPVLQAQIKKQCENKKVFLLVSGGVDSTVVFALLNKTLGPDRVLGLHIDTGLMRLSESQQVMEFMNSEGFTNLKICDATDTFLNLLKGKVDPEEKRSIIGETFLTVKDQELTNLKLNPDEWLVAQGTIYPDTIESGGTENAALIKTHHNRVAGILELMQKGLIIEPISELYKDEVRALGELLNIPPPLVWRHPFPGPGLGVRLLCNQNINSDISNSDLQASQKFLEKHSISGQILPVKSVGVQGDQRTYAHPFLIRGDLSWEQCETISTAATNSIRAVNRVVYEIDALEKNYKVIELYCEKQPLDFLRKMDSLATEILSQSEGYDKVWQMPVVMLPLENKGKPVIVIRPVLSTEAMTAKFAPLSKIALQKLWKAIEAEGAGALLFDITHKPPGTIEWE